MNGILMQLLVSEIPNLSPLGLDWWIILGGWLPGSLAVVAAIIVYLRSRNEEGSK